LSNFREIARDLAARGAARVVRDAEDLIATVPALLTDGATRATMAVAAQEWHRANQGAVERTMAVIREELARVDRYRIPLGLNVIPRDQEV
jgi:3-deoxy-D-manno-octulosonic-acid transferase